MISQPLLGPCVLFGVWEEAGLTWSCLKSHKACTMTGLLLLSSGLRDFSLTMFLDLLTRLWTCLLFSMMRSFSFCKTKKPKSVLTAVVQGLELHTHKPGTVHQTYWTDFTTTSLKNKLLSLPRRWCFVPLLGMSAFQREELVTSFQETCYNMGPEQTK